MDEVEAALGGGLFTEVRDADDHQVRDDPEPAPGTGARARVYVSSPQPTQVPGYQAALSRAWLPVTPATKPDLIPGPTAQGALFRFIGFAFGSIIALLLVLKAVAIPWWAAAPGSCVLLCAWARAWVWQERIMHTEMQAGYITVTPACGILARDVDRRWPGENTGAGWDITGLWLLDRHGHVVTSPDRNVLPPGWYPSPNFPDQFEFWTGMHWAYRYLPWPGSRDGTEPEFGAYRTRLH